MQGRLYIRKSSHTRQIHRYKTKRNLSDERFRVFRWQGQKDLNPQPTVLETATLPIELYPYKNQRLPILPGRFHPSTFGVCGLNCCVRHGNRWIPAAIATELCYSGVGQVRHKRFTQFCVSSPTPSKLVLCLSYPDNCIKMFSS